MTPAQCRAARGLLRWNQDDLAREASVSVVTVRNFENEKSTPQRASIEVMRRALEAAGIQFIPENGGGAGVRLAKPSTASQGSEDAEARDSTARNMAAHQVNKALKNVVASPGEKASRRDRLTKPPKRQEQPVVEGKRPDELDASNDD